MTIRKTVNAKRARDIDESTLSTAPEDCLRNFPNLKETRKEQKNLSTKLGSWKRCFCDSDNGFRQKFVFLAVYTSDKSCSEFRSYDNR